MLMTYNTLIFMSVDLMTIDIFGISMMSWTATWHKDFYIVINFIYKFDEFIIIPYFQNISLFMFSWE